MGACELRVTAEQLQKLRSAEAVALTIYTRTDGSEYSRIDAMGSVDEMQTRAETRRICILTPGLVSVRSDCVLVSDLIPPTPGSTQ